MTPTFSTVEDYIEFIAGYRDIGGKRLGLFNTVPSPISLARYDVSIVASLAEQTLNLQNGYTDKQAELAKKIVSKYRRQLSSLPIPIYLPESLDKFRLTIRIIDRTKSISLHGNVIKVRFPFDTAIIDSIKKQSREGFGSVKFEYDQKVWNLALTESNLNWAAVTGRLKEFNLSDDISQLYNQLIASEKQDYRIELIESSTGFSITNAANSLVEYIDQHLGGFGSDNFLRLADNSEILGYTVCAELEQRLWDDYGKMSQLIMIGGVARTSSIKNLSLYDIMVYARKVNRLPVYVYTTDTWYKHNGINDQTVADTEEIKYINKEHSTEIKPKLLITTTSLMIGSRKESWRQNAEKVIILE